MCLMFTEGRCPRVTSDVAPVRCRLWGSLSGLSWIGSTKQKGSHGPFWQFKFPGVLELHRQPPAARTSGLQHAGKPLSGLLPWGKLDSSSLGAVSPVVKGEE